MVAKGGEKREEKGIKEWGVKEKLSVQEEERAKQMKE